MSNQHIMSRVVACLLLASLVLASGCGTKKPATLTERSTGAGDDDLPFILGCGGDLSSPLQRIYFDYNSALLRSDAVATLTSNAAAMLDGRVSGYVLISGHGDERGTQEYNLALGERRALTVRESLMRLGVPGDRLATLSYGEESPAVEGSGEDAWAQNRRCEFNVASSVITFVLGFSSSSHRAGGLDTLAVFADWLISACGGVMRQPERPTYKLCA